MFGGLGCVDGGIFTIKLTKEIEIGGTVAD
jgi:hypothetical protein